MENPAGNPKQTRVLVVEDDRVFRRLISDTLEKKGFDVRSAEHGAVAKTMIDLADSPFDVIVSDVKMPNVDGIVLLEYVKQKAPLSKMILMTGFDELLEANSAAELGADEFISKPFRSEALLRKIERCLNPTEKAEPAPVEEKQDDLYCQIPIEHFLSTSRLVSDLYVKLGSDRYIKVAARDENCPMERLKTYKEKKVEFLYVRREDFGKYVNFTLKITRLAAASDKVSARQKALLFRHTAEVLSEQVHFAGMDKSTMGFAKQIVEDAVKTVCEDRQLLAFLSESSQDSDVLYAHNLTVSVLASMISREHGWAAPASLFKCAVGGLFHDIGKREIDISVLRKPRLMQTAAEIKLYESHPTRSRDILQQISCLPDEIALIAYHHHENPSGTGFPQGLTSDQIHPVASLINVADKFVTQVFPIQHDATPLTPVEALTRMSTVQADALDMTFLRRLISLFPEYVAKSA